MKVYVYVVAAPLSHLTSASDGHWGHYRCIIPDGYYDREAAAVQAAQTCCNNKQPERFELTRVGLMTKLIVTLCQRSKRIISVFITRSGELLLSGNDKRSSMLKCTQARFC